MGKPILIVGQGIAGTHFAFLLEKNKIPFKLIDKGLDQGASQEAAGIINPVTGRRYVKSWRFDEIQKSVHDAYSYIGESLSQNYLHPKVVYRYLNSAKEENDWMARMSQEGYSQFLRMATKKEQELLEQNFRRPTRLGVIEHVFQLDVLAFLNSAREKFIQDGNFIEEDFDDKLVQAFEAGVHYKHQEYSAAVFCRGLAEPLIKKYYPHAFVPAKGELFRIKGDFKLEHALVKDRLILAHLRDDVYWYGATYEWHSTDSLASEPKNKELKDELARFATGSYEIEEHRAAIRPTVKDHRPIIGKSVYPNIYILNGMGTKGASLAPYCSEILLSHIQTNEAIDPSLEIKRFLEE